ncbi:MAG TPA: nuclear transport factor 2 family protein [Kofleriaceae bacterium]|nr:nuclear transport factor 2 family protein [Kofleriaceae bacterium]
MRAAITCLVVGSLVACTGRGGGGAAKPRGPVGPAIDAKEAEEGASDLVTEIYDTLGRGNKDSLFTLLDDSLIVFGPRGPDMLGTRADALVALGQVVDPKAKKKLAIRSGKLEVVAAPGGRSALAFDAANINGQPHTVMAVLTNASDLWLVDAVAVARVPAAAALPAELAKDAVLPPGMAGTRRMDPEARLAVEKFQKGLLDQAAWGDELASHAEGLVVGPTAGEVARGKQAIEAMWKKRVDAKTRAAISGPITAAVTDDGQLAWVSAPITRVEGEGTQPLPLRAFAVYTQDGGDWKLLALHESLAVGEPGSGAAFKKVIPPKPVEPKPVELIADKPKADKGKGGETPKAAKKAKAAKAAKAAKPVKAAKPEPQKPPPEVKAKPKQPPPEVKAKPEKQEAKARPEKPAKTAEIEMELEPEPPKKKPKTKAKAKAKAKDDDEGGDRPKKRTFARAMAGEDRGGRSEEVGEEPKKSKKSKKSRSKAADEEAEDEAPKDRKLAKAEAEAEEAPKKKKKKAKAAAAGDDEDQPKKKKAKPAKAAEEAPKSKKKKKAPPPDEDEDEDEIEIID